MRIRRTVCALQTFIEVPIRLIYGTNVLMINTKTARIMISGTLLCCGLLAVTIYTLVLFNTAPSLRQEKEYPVLEWFRAPTVACGGNWTGFGNEMVVLKNARILNTSAFAVPCTDALEFLNTISVTQKKAR